MNFKTGVFPASFDANLRFNALVDRVKKHPGITYVHCNSGVHRGPQVCAGVLAVADQAQTYNECEPELQIGGSVL